MKYFKILSLLAIVAAMAMAGCKSNEEKYVNHFKQGEDHLEKGNYKAAEIEFKNALQKNPEQTEVYENLGELYLKQGNTKDAFAAFSTLAKLDPENLDARLKVATFYMLGQKTDEALKIIDEILAKEPENTNALFILAAIEEQGGRLVEADALYAKIIEIDREQVQAYLRSAGIKVRNHKLPEAEELIKQAVAVKPENLQARLGLFYFYVGTRQFDNARGEIDKLVEAHPKNENLMVLLGNFHFMLRNKNKALEAYTQALEMNPENIKLYMILGGFYDALGEKENTLATYNKALNLQPDNIQVKYAIARFHFKNRNVNEAESYIDQILEKRREHLGSRILKGELLIGKGLPDEALAIFNQLAVDYPNSADVLYHQGVAYFAKGQLRIAKQSLTKAIDFDPQFVKANVLLSEIFLLERDFDAAQEKSRQVLSDNPNNFRAALVLGNTYIHQKNFPEAEKMFDLLIRLQPENPVGYSRIGVVMRMQKKNDAALENFEKALSLNPRLIEILSHIVSIHIENKEVDKALKRCDLQMETLKDRPELTAKIYYLKGAVYLSQQDRQGAVAAFEKAMDLDRDYLEPYYAIASIDILLDRDIEKGIGKYKAILDKQPDSVRAHMILAIIYEIKKDYDAAIEHYRKVLDSTPGSSVAKNNLAYRLAEKEENLNEALKLAQEAKENHPEDPRIADTLGWVYYKKGLYDLAINEFLSSAKALPENADIQYHLGMAYFQKGEMERAKTALERALDLNEKFENANHARQILSSL